MIQVNKMTNTLDYISLLNLTRIAGYEICVFEGVAEASRGRCSARVNVEGIPDGSYAAVVIPDKVIRLRTALTDVERIPRLFEGCAEHTSINVASHVGIQDEVDKHTGLPISAQTARAIWNSQGGGVFDIHYTLDEDRAVIIGENMSAVLHIPEKTKNILLGGLTTEEHKTLKRTADARGLSVSSLLREYVRDSMRPPTEDRLTLTLTPDMAQVFRIMSELTGQTINELVNEVMEKYIA